MFEIKLTNDFIEYRKSLKLKEMAILDVRILYLKNTGKIGNCNILNDGFEFRINDKFKIFCNIDSESKIIIFTANKNDLKLLNNNTTDYTNWQDIYLESLKQDIKYCKLFFKELRVYYNNTKQDLFFEYGLRCIFEIQGSINFKKITSYNYEDILVDDIDKEYKTLQELIRKDRVSIRLGGLSKLSKEIGIEESVLTSILNIRANIDLKMLLKYIKRYNKTNKNTE